MEEIHSFESEILSLSLGPSTFSMTDIEYSESDPVLAPLRFAVSVKGNSRVFEVYKKGNDWISLTVGNHTDQCNTIAWSSNLGSSDEIIASGGKDGRVIVWSKDRANSEWVLRAEIPFDSPVVGVSWNKSGKVNNNIIVLQVTMKDGTTLLFKETILDCSTYDLMAEIDPQGNLVSNEIRE